MSWRCSRRSLGETFEPLPKHGSEQRGERRRRVPRAATTRPACAATWRPGTRDGGLLAADEPVLELPQPRAAAAPRWPAPRPDRRRPVRSLVWTTPCGVPVRADQAATFLASSLRRSISMPVVRTSGRRRLRGGSLRPRWRLAGQLLVLALAQQRAHLLGVQQAGDARGSPARPRSRSRPRCRTRRRRTAPGRRTPGSPAPRTCPWSGCRRPCPPGWPRPSATLRD